LLSLAEGDSKCGSEGILAWGNKAMGHEKKKKNIV